MPYTEFFQCKRIRIFHDEDIMKTSTDSMLLGAWCKLPLTGHVLDIGTGSGILSLMIAQRNDKLNITAIDNAVEAIDLCKHNIMYNNMLGNILPVHLNFVDYIKEPQRKFQLIVSNPPYFKEDLLSPDQSKNQVRHQQDLTFELVLNGASVLLQDYGKLAIVLPASKFYIFDSVAKDRNFSCFRKCEVKDTEDKPSSLVLAEYVKGESNMHLESLVLYEGTQRKRTPAYTELLQDFYLD